MSFADVGVTKKDKTHTGTERSNALLSKKRESQVSFLSECQPPVVSEFPSVLLQGDGLCSRDGPRSILTETVDNNGGVGQVPYDTHTSADNEVHIKLEKEKILPNMTASSAQAVRASYFHVWKHSTPMVLLQPCKGRQAVHDFFPKTTHLSLRKPFWLCFQNMCRT